MAAGRLFIPGWMPARDSNGDPIPNVSVSFYVNGTDILAVVYADEALTTPLANPVYANSSGRFPQIYADDTVLYSASVEAPYGPAGQPFTFDGLQASQAADIAAANLAQGAAEDAEAALAEITEVIEAAQAAGGGEAAVAGAIAGAAAGAIAAAGAVNGVTALIPSVQLRSYYNGNLPYVDPSSAITYSARQAAPNITTALNATITVAKNLQNAGNRKVRILLPPGLFTVTGPILVPDGIHIEGSGMGTVPSATHIRTITTTGDTFQFGTPGPDNRVTDAGMSDLFIYQDWGGNGMYGFQPPAAGDFINKATSGAQLRVTGATYCTFERLRIFGKRDSAVFLGGSTTRVDIETYGIWDPDNVSRQEGYSGLTLDANVNTVGINIPTYFDLSRTITGGATKSATVNYPGGNSFATVQNIGPQYGIVLQCYEELYGERLNLSAAQKSCLLLKSSSTRIMQGINLGVTFGPCGTDVNDAMIRFENADAGGQISGGMIKAVCLGQGNGYRAVSDRQSTATFGSSQGLSLDITASTFVGTPVWLENARNVRLDINARDYNTKNYYVGGEAAGVYLDATKVVNVSVYGTLGGSVTGARTGHFCAHGVYVTGYTANSGLEVYAANGGTNSTFYFGPPNPNTLNSTTADFTLTWGVDSPVQLSNGTLGSNITCSLSTAGPPPNGARFTIIRAGAGSGNLVVTGFQNVTLAPVTGGGKKATTFEYMPFLSNWYPISYSDIPGA